MIRMNNNKPVKTARARDDLREILLYAIEHVEASRLVREHVRLQGERLLVGSEVIHLERGTRIFIGGIGKAAERMALPLEEALGDRITDGLVIVKHAQGSGPQRVEVREAGHPYPDGRSLGAARELVRRLGEYGENDVVIFLVSGGGSSLLALPANGLTLDDKIVANRVLLGSGATIAEINTVRRCLSSVKGGKLLPEIFPASLINVVLSDVIGDDLEIIASGPTIPARTDPDGPVEVVNRYNLAGVLPAAVLDRLKSGQQPPCRGRGDESTVAEPEIKDELIGNNRLLLEHAAARAEALGYATRIMATQFQGKAREEAMPLVSAAIRIENGERSVETPVCLIAGGETTVAVRGGGLGGRCQEFALEMALLLEGKAIVGLAAGSDGTDGPTDAAGAIVDGETCRRGKASGLDALDHLERNDSHPFLRATGDLIVTGPTGTNVNDIYACIISR